MSTRLHVTVLCASGMAALMLGLAAPARAQIPVNPAHNPIAAQPLDRLAVTRERPLFSPNRRPPAPPPVVARFTPPPPPAALAPPEPPNISLFGIVTDADGARAVVRNAASDKVMRLRIGDQIGDWKVTQIESRRLVLSLAERSETFTLFDGKNASQVAGGDPVYKPPGRTVQVTPQVSPIRQRIRPIR